MGKGRDDQMLLEKWRGLTSALGWGKWYEWFRVSGLGCWWWRKAFLVQISCSLFFKTHTMWCRFSNLGSFWKTSVANISFLKWVFTLCFNSWDEAKSIFASPLARNTLKIHMCPDCWSYSQSWAHVSSITTHQAAQLNKRTHYIGYRVLGVGGCAGKVFSLSPSPVVPITLLSFLFLFHSFGLKTCASKML